MTESVSIIIPVYNCEKYLDDCLISVENQTYHNIEVIIVNDGSKDNGLEIIKKYIEKNKDWKLIDQKNQGLSMSRNNGYDIATGKYIFFLDSDDEIPNDAIEKLVESAKKNNSDIVIGNMINYNSKGKYPNYTSKYIKDKNSINYKNFPKLFAFIHAAGKLYKRESIENVKFISGVKHEDNYFNLSLYLKKLNISMIKNDVYYHRVREGNDKSITQDLSYLTFKDLLVNYNKVLEENFIDCKLNTILSRKVINYVYLKLNSDESLKAKNDIKVFMKKIDEKTCDSAMKKKFAKINRKMYLCLVKFFSFLKRK